MFRRAKHQAGMGLVEVLVAAAIFSLGVLAVVKLQGEFLRGSGEADARAIAMQLAQEKLDDLRRFGTSDANGFAFTAIGNNAGGYPAGEGGVVAGNHSVGSATYNLNWAVVDNFYNSTTKTISSAATTPATSAVQKQVTITVSWVDSAGATQTVQLTDIVNSMASSAAAGLAGGSTGVTSSSPGPEATYTPSTSSGVVPVSVGTGTNRETLVPTASGTEVKFTAYTYNSTGKLLRQEDFITVGCTCQFNGSGSGKTAAHAVWDTDTKSFVDDPGDSVTKTVGVPANNQQDSLCDTCCNDHHDPVNTLVDNDGDGQGDGAKYCDPAAGVLDRCYDPFRDAGGTNDETSGRHNHYNAAGAVVTSGTYLESCRMKRVNGFWQAYQDWHRVDVQAFELSDTNGNVVFSGNAKTDYANYVQAIVDMILDDGSIATFKGQSLNLASLTQPTAKKTSASPLVMAPGDKVQLTGRAVYVDYLGSTLLTNVRQKKTAGSDYLIDVPFYEVEVTTRAPTCTESPTPTLDSAYVGGWCPPSSGHVSVGAAGNGANALNSGQVKAVSSTAFGTTENVVFDFRKSNSGLTGSSSPVDQNTSAVNRDRLKDRATVAVQVTGASPPSVTLTVTLSGGTPTSGQLSFTDANGTVNCTGSGVTYSCPINYSVAGTLHFNGSTATDTCVETSGSNSYPAETANASKTLPITCTAAQVSYPLTITFAYNPSNKKADAGTVTTNPASVGNCTAIAAPSGQITGCTGNGYICGFSCQVSTSSGTISFTGTRTQGQSTFACSSTGTPQFSGATQSGGTATVTVACQ